MQGQNHIKFGSVQLDRSRNFFENHTWCESGSVTSTHLH